MAAMIQHFQLGDRAKIAWNGSGTIADVYFPTGKATAVVLTMPAEALRLLREDIDTALSHKPRATPDQ